MKEINIAKNFSETPGSRYITEGPFSGQEFREKYLEPLFEDSTNDEKIVINLDGVEGYATSFLEEAFGGLARKYGKEVVFKRLEYISLEDLLLVEEINMYIEQSDK